MLSIVISWIVIFIFSYVYGRTIIAVCYQNKTRSLLQWDSYVICGLMFLTIYAQVFSLFTKVGRTAFLVLMAGLPVCIMFLRKKDMKIEAVSPFSLVKFQLFFLIAGVAGTVIWTDIIPQHYDTYLYHAQAVHWIEEYGVVPGLGNLHFRLAYNSAFLPLQALFSFKWLLGQSLHTMNGFVVLCFLCYIAFSLKFQKTGKIEVSDLLKLGMVFYIVISCYNISSLSTDIWPLLLVFYICIKWIELWEEGVEEPEAYAFLCVLSVYAVTLKLSVVIFVLLSVYPAVCLIKQKNWKSVIMHILLGVVNVIPFMIRNVILSGYLIYPYPEIDLFHFDWKMNQNVMLGDRKLIMVWGRGLRDVSEYSRPFREWFPVWLTSIHTIWRVAFFITLVLIVPAVFFIIKNRKKSESVIINLLIAACIAGLFYWLFSAPLPRYGLIYILLLPGLVFGLMSQVLTERFKGLFYFIRKRILPGCFILGACFSLCFFFCYRTFAETGNVTFIMQNDYLNRETRQIEVNGISFWVPLEYDQTGYEPFPTVVYEGYFDEILELRGDTLEKGFRYKEVGT